MRVTAVRRIPVIEGVTFAVDPSLRDPLRVTMMRLRRQLSLSFPPLTEDEGGFRISNLVGAVDVGGTILDVAPKTEPDDDWVASVLALLVGSDAVDAAGERAAGRSAARPDLLEALAAAYAARLERALRRDGPLAIMQREETVASSLRGKLMVSDWARRVVRDPARFPQRLNRLSVDNDFSRALAVVAARFARAVRRLPTRARLLEAVQLLRPGLPEVGAAPVGVEARQLPQQWAVYRPAWSIATAVLARRSLLGPQGTQAGVSVAIEPWPLLERLLERSLQSASAQAQARGRALSAPAKGSLFILRRTSGAALRDHDLEPDGILVEGGNTLATFEAKYRAYDPARGPERNELYQAIAAARAASSPLAVLVFPGRLETGVWRVEAPGPFPERLAVVGLDMFSYRPGGERDRGLTLLGLVSP